MRAAGECQAATALRISTVAVRAAEDLPEEAEETSETDVTEPWEPTRSGVLGLAEAEALNTLNDAWGKANVPVVMVHPVSEGSKETAAIKKAADFAIKTTHCGGELAELDELAEET